MGVAAIINVQLDTKDMTAKLNVLVVTLAIAVTGSVVVYSSIIVIIQMDIAELDAVKKDTREMTAKLNVQEVGLAITVKEPVIANTAINVVKLMEHVMMENVNLGT